MPSLAPSPSVNEGSWCSTFLSEFWCFHCFGFQLFYCLYYYLIVLIFYALMTYDVDHIFTCCFAIFFCEVSVLSWSLIVFGVMLLCYDMSLSLFILLKIYYNSWFEDFVSFVNYEKIISHNFKNIFFSHFFYNLAFKLWVDVCWLSPTNTPLSLNLSCFLYIGLFVLYSTLFLR